MIKQSRLEDLIREKIPLGKVSSKGFHIVKCAVCNDYKERGGFKFENGEVGYSDFNCGAAFRYTEFSGKISANARQVLNAFGISDSEIDTVVNSAFFFEKKNEAKITLESLKKVNTATPPIKLPAQSFRLGSVDAYLYEQLELVKYLEDRRVDLNRYTFFFSLEERMKNRVIIPFYRNRQLIYWQARSIDPLEKKRYENPSVGRDAVMFNMDALNSYSSLPLFVSEGVFDAMMFDGLATLGSKLNDAKVLLIRESKRRPVFVIDKDKNGASLARTVLDHGWEITFTPDGTSDLNNSVKRFGKSWTAYELMKNIKSGNDAELAISINCK